MRKNTARVLDAWTEGREDRQDQSIWTDGRRIFSYQTVLVEHGGSDTPFETAPVLLNRTRYSATTTRQQNDLAFGLSLGDVVIVTGVPQGSQDLTRYL